MHSKVAVFFPGTGYTCDRPLLRRCALRYAELGYQLIKLNHDGIDFRSMERVEDALDAARLRVTEQVKDIDFSQYGDVVFVAKSLGTAVAPWLDEKMNAKARHLFLTPIPPALPFLSGPDRVIAAVIGSEDPHLSAETLQHHCEQRSIPYMIIPGVGHNLEYPDDSQQNEKVLEQITALCC